MRLSSFWMLGIVGLFTLAGCAASQELPPSGPHAPTTPDQVLIYQTAPAKYEMLGTVSLEITPEPQWDISGNANPAFELMKKKAAALGANGLLLDTNTPGATYTVVAGYGGTFYKVPMHHDPLTAVNKAIFVLAQ